MAVISVANAIIVEINAIDISKDIITFKTSFNTDFRVSIQAFLLPCLMTETYVIFEAGLKCTPFALLFSICL